MNKQKLILGILTIICSSLILIMVLVLGISYYTGHYYIDIKSFPFEPTVSIDENLELFPGEYSFWLKIPNRQIENKDIQFLIFLTPQDGSDDITMKENFNVGYFRNSAGNGQYYKIGEQNFENDFIGKINYSFTGEWSFGNDSEIVIRESHLNDIISKEFWVLFAGTVAGIVLLIVGIKIISQSKAN